ncbi:MAG: hypothetical protein AB1717_03545 [Pseudomonadota bacterium]
MNIDQNYLVLVLIPIAIGMTALIVARKGFEENKLTIVQFKMLILIVYVMLVVISVLQLIHGWDPGLFRQS